VRPTLDDGQILPPVLAGDQLVTDFRVATLVKAWKRRIPLVLIAGSGYKLLPFKLNCSYAVLGWYVVPERPQLMVGTGSVWYGPKLNRWLEGSSDQLGGTGTSASRSVSIGSSVREHHGGRNQLERRNSRLPNIRKLDCHPRRNEFKSRNSSAIPSHLGLGQSVPSRRVAVPRSMRNSARRLVTRTIHQPLSKSGFFVDRIKGSRLPDVYGEPPNVCQTRPAVFPHRP
jgi:hypothetical protein